VVEDNVDTAEMLTSLLEMLGHEVRAARDGPEALDLAPVFRPQIVLLDIGLPGLDGYEVARRLRAQPGGRDLLLIALTGYGSAQDRERARQAGCDHHVTKPVEVIPTGIRLDRFKGRDGERFRKMKGYQPEDQVVLFMGRVAEEKNIDFLMRVVHRLKPKVPHLQFLIAGEGAAKKHLEKMRVDLGMESYVHFAGYLSKEDWRDCYAGSDLFVFASITETQGLVVTEAMAAETPVVAVAEMGIKDVMASGRGGLTTSLNEDEFTDAVIARL